MVVGTVLGFVVVMGLVVLAIRGGPAAPPPDREQQRRDDEDVAIYGAIVREPVEEERERSRD